MGKNVFIEIFLAVDVFISAKIQVSKYVAPIITPNNDAKISKEVKDIESNTKCRRSQKK